MFGCHGAAFSRARKLQKDTRAESEKDAKSRIYEVQNNIQFPRFCVGTNAGRDTLREIFCEFLSEANQQIVCLIIFSNLFGQFSGNHNSVHASFAPERHAIAKESGAQKCT